MIIITVGLILFVLYKITEIIVISFWGGRNAQTNLLRQCFDSSEEVYNGDVILGEVSEENFVVTVQTKSGFFPKVFINIRIYFVLNEIPGCRLINVNFLFTQPRREDLRMLIENEKNILIKEGKEVVVDKKTVLNLEIKRRMLIEKDDLLGLFE